MPERVPQSSVVQLVDAACRVVGSDVGVKTITVVANRRLLYDELARLRAHARACNTDFLVGGNGTVVVRRAARESLPNVTVDAPNTTDPDE